MAWQNILAQRSSNISHSLKDASKHSMKSHKINENLQPAHSLKDSSKHSMKSHKINENLQATHSLKRFPKA
jgi:hypothetical protein